MTAKVTASAEVRDFLALRGITEEGFRTHYGIGEDVKLTVALMLQVLFSHVEQFAKALESSGLTPSPAMPEPEPAAPPTYSYPGPTPFEAPVNYDESGDYVDEPEPSPTFGTRLSSAFKAIGQFLGRILD